MSEFKTPAGRVVQGKMTPQQRKDMTTKEPQWKDAAKTIPDMGTFFSLAFPKKINGADSAEFATFYQLLVTTAAAAWPALFPQGAAGACTHPRFSWKLQDGDGVDFQGKSVATKPGFAGHWVVKFDTNFPVKVFNDGQFAPHQELPEADKIVKRGFWVRVYGEMKSNMASGTQVPGISLYPNLVSFLGGRPEDEIVSGPDAQTAFGAAHAGWRPDGISQVPGAPVGGPVGLPAPGGAPVGLPTPPASIAAPVAPQYTVRADLAAQGHTLQTLAAHGTPEQLVAAGYLTVMTPPPAPVAPPLPGAPAGLPVPGATLPTPGLPNLMPPASLVPPAAVGPRYELKPEFVAQGVTLAGLIEKGWTNDALVQAGHAVKIG